MAKQNKLNQINKLIETAHVSLESARQLLGQLVGKDIESTEVATKARSVGKMDIQGEEKIVEGIFDGQGMVGPDGKQYSIPANYASKSKLVVGDTLKLTIMPEGTFKYKQIGPVDRDRLVGLLAKDETTDEYKVIVGEKTYKVLLASITYFKGEAGDEVVLLVPKGQDCEWAAVENIIKIGQAEATNQVVDKTGAKATAGKVEEIEDLG